MKRPFPLVVTALACLEGALDAFERHVLGAALLGEAELARVHDRAAAVRERLDHIVDALACASGDAR